jgi:hypothetical protein
LSHTVNLPLFLLFLDSDHLVDTTYTPDESFFLMPVVKRVAHQLQQSILSLEDQFRHIPTYVPVVGNRLQSQAPIRHARGVLFQPDKRQS